MDAQVGGKILPRIATIESDERLEGRVQAVFPIAFLKAQASRAADCLAPIQLPFGCNVSSVWLKGWMAVDMVLAGSIAVTFAVTFSKIA